MKNLKKIGLISILAAALITGPMPGIKASHNKTLETTSQVLTLEYPLAYAEDYINFVQPQNFQPPKEEDLVGKLQWPLDDFTITQRFGENKGTYYKNGHAGVDFMSEFGARIKAAANGIVVAKGTDECPNFENLECNYRSGNWIMLWHPDLRIHTVYSHLKGKPYKEIGEKIWRGETIGYEGSSGFQIEIKDGNLKPITGDSKSHHLDFMVGIFNIIKTREGKIGYQVIRLYDPLKFLPPLDEKK